MNLVAASGCLAYDCEFVALAQWLGITLVTSDSEILKVFPQAAISLEGFAGKRQGPLPRRPAVSMLSENVRLIAQ